MPLEPVLWIQKYSILIRILNFGPIWIRAVDPHSFFADPDPDVFLNADPDPDPDADPDPDPDADPDLEPTLQNL